MIWLEEGGDELLQQILQLKQRSTWIHTSLNGLLTIRWSLTLINLWELFVWLDFWCVFLMIKWYRLITKVISQITECGKVRICFFTKVFSHQSDLTSFLIRFSLIYYSGKKMDFFRFLSSGNKRWWYLQLLNLSQHHSFLILSSIFCNEMSFHAGKKPSTCRFSGLVIETGPSSPCWSCQKQYLNMIITL